ncbi:MAG: ISNCY family transposase [Gammaproteobacteria bacterium]|nr:ISNCY family transposase [Gammaproteobacteria bacterium]
MRKIRTAQSSIFELFAGHEIGRELQAMSAWLDEHPELLAWVAEDLGTTQLQDTGREGMTAESVLRCALLKQHRQLSYEELAFHLLDSVSFQAFARLPVKFVPKKSALQLNISSIRAKTWERINRSVLGDAKSEGVEKGQAIRIDSTVTETPIHEPSDSTLLWDSLRVLVRLLEGAQALPGAPKLHWHNHSRVGKRRARQIHYTRGKEKKAPLYRDLVKVVQDTLGYAQAALVRLTAAGLNKLDFELWRAELAHYTPLIERVIEQTSRRVFNGERVPAREKLFSLFEEHTDIVVKGAREIQYGHKLNLSGGQSGLILDAVIEQGNPADAERFLPMLDRHIERYGRAPRQAAADGGYASVANLREAKEKGVKDVAFHKKRGLSVAEMVKSQWVYRKLRNFRAGIEAGISCLKRAYGLARCTWKGVEHYGAYVWSSIVAYNLSLFTRLRPA